ncbi:MAG: hypothetical protein M3019_10775 [Candidatus Dormibacteraeota bacterium]|nr:hypothetical protein [Candidatus Dormibacteraeota bacterium]
MSDQPNLQTSRIADPIPLLPRGDVLFDAIPLNAVVMEALAPALSHGCLVVRDRDRGAVVLARDGALVEVHAFSGATARTGEGVLAEVQGWAEAVVTAHRLEPLLVDVCEALLRGEIIYSDLRLDWVEWPNLLADFTRRGGAYAVEIFTPAGRGVTCVAVGQQALSYTDIHPSFGDPALLEAMASNRDGSIRVRRLNAASFAATAMATGGQIAGAGSGRSAPASPTSEPLASGDRGNGAARSEPRSNAPAAHESASQEKDRDRERERHKESEPAQSGPGPVGPLGRSVVDDALPDLTWVAPWQTPWRDEPEKGGSAGNPLPRRPASTTARPSVGDMLGDLRSIAQRRLQLSASRVETILDEAAREQRPLDPVLEEIRSMSIRGVMPSTVDAMVAEMKIAAAEYRSV